MKINISIQWNNTGKTVKTVVIKILMILRLSGAIDKKQEELQLRRNYDMIEE